MGFIKILNQRNNVPFYISIRNIERNVDNSIAIRNTPSGFSISIGTLKNFNYSII